MQVFLQEWQESRSGSLAR